MQGGVLCRIGLVSAVVSCPCYCHSSLCPPHKQLLTGMVQGAVAMGSGCRCHWPLLVVVLASWLLLSLMLPALLHEQLLMAVVRVLLLWYSSCLLERRPVAPEPPCKQVLAVVGAGAGVCLPYTTPTNHPMSSCS
jgi:hypothetical protein